ncbi:MAG: cytochrome c biogenesis protein CcsA [Deltaproteobacteria bacterium]|nr:cytochrome c biogenesis protein CcsA [Deltaproteobacteria bacterium]
MKGQRWLVALTAVTATLIAASGFFGDRKGRQGVDVVAFGELPAQEGGRVKPIDTLARNALLMIRSKQTVRADGRTLSASEWLLDAMFRPQLADTYAIFVVDDPDVLGLMGMPQSAERYYSFDKLRDHTGKLQSQASAARRVDPKQRTRFQAAVVHLFDRLYLYYRIKHTLQIEGGAGLSDELARAHTQAGQERAQAIAELAYFRVLPPTAKGGWRNIGEGLAALHAGTPQPGLELYAAMQKAYVAGDGANFDAAVAKMLALGRAADPTALGIAAHELQFNRAQPFYNGMVLYVAALLVLFASWAWRPQTLRPVAYVLLAAGLLLHTGGLVSRTILQGRPPVTNLYSSAVFVGWGAAVLGAVLERLYRNGFGAVVAAASGFVSLIVAHHLAADGDTMEMMRAVLDSNFWLATHVITITIGYSGTFVAGAIAAGWAIRRHALRSLDPEAGKALASMTYGIQCFALLFSFAGTVLGGIWADQSWGRFWGWDPKENGALLIVLWIAIVLHARWGGYIRERGLMAMSIAGMAITAFSWFGVNMLGVGLHSYGFTDKAFSALAAFMGLCLLLLGLSLAPPRFRLVRTLAAGLPVQHGAATPHG